MINRHAWIASGDHKVRRVHNIDFAVFRLAAVHNSSVNTIKTDVRLLAKRGKDNICCIPRSFGAGRPNYVHSASVAILTLVKYVFSI